MSTARIYVAELVAYDARIAGTTTLRYATRSFTTRPSDTPANTTYLGLLAQPVNIARSIFSPGATQGRSVVSLGEVILSNGDGALDELLNYAFDGRAITIRSGTFGAAYPSGFTTEFVGTMEHPEFSAETVRVKLRDRAAEIDVPFQQLFYGGTNVLPDGEDGTADDLAGKPRPFIYGNVLNITPPCVNTSRLIYELSSGGVDYCSAVRDAGVTLTQGANYTSMADMRSNAPSAGQYRFLPSTGAGSFFRLGSSPSGVITADANLGLTPSLETHAQTFSLVLARTGFYRGDSSLFVADSDDITALDAADSSVIGFYHSINDRYTVPQVLDIIANSCGAWWKPDVFGVFRIKQLAAPTGTPVLTINASDVTAPIERLPTTDPTRDLPVYQVTARYRRNYTPQTEFAGSVTDAFRNFYAQPWSATQVSDTSVQTAHLLAATLTLDTLYALESNALTEATRRLNLRKIQRHRFQVTLLLTDENAGLELGDIVGFRHPRFGLTLVGDDVGQLFVVIGVEPDAAAGLLHLTLWGNAFTVFNLATEASTDAAPEYFLTEAGDYLLTE